MCLIAKFSQSFPVLYDCRIPDVVDSFVKKRRRVSHVSTEVVLEMSAHLVRGRSCRHPLECALRNKWRNTDCLIDSRICRCSKSVRIEGHENRLSRERTHTGSGKSAIGELVIGMGILCGDPIIDLTMHVIGPILLVG
jgi:hypothetical protein